MLTLKEYLVEYQKSHVHPTNILIHKFCVPLIVFSIIGLLFSLPYTIGALKVVDIVCILALVYYFILSKKYFFIMIPQLVLYYLICLAIQPTGQLFTISLIIFIISWIFQLYGHKVEGRKPSFLQDLTFLLIGPIWVVKKQFKLKD